MYFRKFLLLFSAPFILSPAEGQEKLSIPQMPIPIDGEIYERSLDYLWLEKPISDSRLIDNMEDISLWQHKGAGKSSLTSERAKDGSHALRLISPTMANVAGPTLTIGMSSGPVIGFPYGSSSVLRAVDNEDWSDYNRLSFWVYPDLPGFRIIVMTVILHNDGVQKVPGPYGGRNGRHFIFLKPGQWNHCVWEIPHLARDKVTGVELEYRLQGNEPGATNVVTYDFDKLELQKVDQDHFEGWQVAPGQIAYCHSGYQPGTIKSAIASDIKSKTFSVVNHKTGKVILTKDIKENKYPNGIFQVLDFSELKTPGTYTIKVGNIQTKPFNIGEDVMRESIIKTINFFYSERCGTLIPGVHDYCHGDWICQHIPTGQRYSRAYQHDLQIIVNGGWHDAGNLAQGTAHSTAKASYAMFKLSERLKDKDPALSNLIYEEATWGLDWVLKTRFGDGYRVSWAPMDAWTDNIIGTEDDIKFTAKNNPLDNFVGSINETEAAGMSKKIDMFRADYYLKCAEEDWKFGRDELKKLDYENGDYLDDVAAGLIASIELYKTTSKEIYSTAAFEFANHISKCQQTENPDWDIPLTGFFYTDKSKKQIYRNSHGSDEYLLMPGLIQLCQLFPGHPDWMKWYSTIALYSNYYKKITEYSRPYDMIPASIYQTGGGKRRYNMDPHSYSEASFENQVKNGIRLSDDYYLRLFPVWFTKRGNTATTLSQAASLFPSAIFRNDARLEEICRKQLEWNLGFNPFSQSLMYGEGYNYSSQYSSMGGNMVGALPVGIQTDYDKDIPYWPSDVCFNYKELWVHSSALWLFLMSDVYDKSEKLKNISNINFQLSSVSESKEKFTIVCRATGNGNVSFKLIGWNINSDNKEIDVSLKKGQEKSIQWEVSVMNPKKPCVVAVIPNNNITEIKDIIFNESTSNN